VFVNSGRSRGFELVDAPGHDGSHVHGDVLGGPVPPGEGEQARDIRLAEACADERGRVPADDAVVGDIVDDDRPRGDDGSVADANATSFSGP
jgi:hypothetical protein